MGRNFHKPNGFAGKGNGTGNFKMGNYFCTNCKIVDHSVGICFKIHGYPTSFKENKDKRIVVVASSINSSEITGSNEGNSDQNTSIFVAQYQQLMELLNKQSLVSNSQTSQDHSDLAMLAGKTCLLVENFSKSEWLIDSDATDHICSYLSMFIKYKPVRKYEFIVIPDGRQVPILHVGSVRI